MSFEDDSFDLTAYTHEQLEQFRCRLENVQGRDPDADYRPRRSEADRRPGGEQRV